MNRIHKVIGDKAIATFDGEPSPELPDAITKMVELAYDNSFELQFLNEETLANKKVCHDPMRDCQLFLNHGFSACEKCDEYE